VAEGLVLSGCLGPWRPPMPQTADRTPPARRVTPADCLETNLVGRWVYRRRELPARPGGAATPYARVIRPGRLSEGVLVDRSLLPLERYLPPAKPAKTAGKRPTAPLGKEWAVFFKLGEPTDPYPPELAEQNTIVSETTLRYYDKIGRPLGHGTLTRTATLEGFEDIQTPAGRFDRCLRVRVDLHVHFPWLLVIDWTTYLWLSAEVGEVRRVQKFSGWFWFFWFGNAHEYLLTSYDVHRMDSPGRPLPRCWTYGLFELDRGVPRPRLSGLVVDMVTTRPAP